MTNSQSLALLRDLQKLREERSKAEHVRAIATAKSAKDGLERAKALLAEGDAALAQYSDGTQIELSQFQILAHIVTQRAADMLVQVARSKEADALEMTARTQRLCAEKQSSHLLDSFKETVKHERRKAEDRRARDFLSSSARKQGVPK